MLKDTYADLWGEDYQSWDIPSSENSDKASWFTSIEYGKIAVGRLFYYLNAGPEERTKRWNEWPKNRTKSDMSDLKQN